MTLPGKFRPGFARLAVAFSAAMLAIGGWVFFSAFSQAVVRAAAGVTAAEAHLADLLFLEQLALTLVVLIGMLLAIAFVAMWSSAEATETQTQELVERLRRLARGETSDDGRKHFHGDELDEIFRAVDALGRALSGPRHGKGSDAAEEVKTRFLEIISHQLRTPLTAIRWNLEALLKGDTGPLSKRQQDLLRITSENYQGILAMLSDWVEALEVERGLLQLNPEPVDLRPFMVGVAEDFKQHALLKRQKFVSAIPRVLPHASIDKLKVRYVMGKLLSNAMAYTPERGRVELRVLPEDARVRIEVEDSGVGIPYGEQSKIFDKFFRASNANLMQPNASGVGLFVARQLVEAHGGTIGFASTEGQGTTFWIVLPTLGVRKKTKT